MTWTRFMDMHSGGGQKEAFSKCYIEAPENEAKAVFYARFGHNPERVTCTCCGDDYSIDESETIEEATSYDRGLRFASYPGHWIELTEEQRKAARTLEPGEAIPDGMEVSDRFGRHGDGLTMDQYLAKPPEPILVIRSGEITDEERAAHVPAQGYVWQD